MPCCCICCARLCAPRRSVERAALGIDGAVGIALAEPAFGLAHGIAGLAERVLLALTLLALAEATLAQFLHQLLELIAQLLLLLLQVAHLLLALTLLALLTARAAAHVLTLLEGLVAQLLLLADHVAELVQRHHVVVAVVAVHLLAGTRHLQILEHLLQLLQHLARGVLGAVAGHLLHAVDHVAQILRPHLPRIGIERAGELLRILAHLLSQRLQILAQRLAQRIGELLELGIGRALRQRLFQRVDGALLGLQRRVGLAVAQALLRVAHGVFAAIERTGLVLGALALLLEQLLELIAQRLLVLAKLIEGVVVLQQLVGLLLQRFLVAPELVELVGTLLHVLVLPGGAVAQLLLLAQEVAQLLRRHAPERFLQRLLRRAQRRFGVRHVAVFEVDRHVPHAGHDIAQLIVGLGAGELPEDRAQAQIGILLHLEFFGREGERIERGEDERLRVGVKGEISPLLDERARQRLAERPLRQAELERRATALRCRLRRAP